jgi:hypothetical protein
MADLTYGPKVYRRQGGDTQVVANGGTILVETGGVITAPGGSSILEEVLSLDIADASVDGTYYMIAPHAGTISKIWSVIDSAVLTADVTVTTNIGATPVTNGLVTIAFAGTVAGDIDSATPTAANVVTAGQAINFVVAGGGSAGTGPRIHLAVVITR